MHSAIIDVFWLQIEADCTLKLRWVRSEDNKEADDLSRPGAGEYERLTNSAFQKLWLAVGRFDMDLMATAASAHAPPPYSAQA